MRAPPLRADFVPRPGEAGRIETALLAPRAPDDAALRVVALHGLGGSGKPLLAAAIARTPEVRAAFPHEMRWATLRRAPNLGAILEGWIRALGNTDFRSWAIETRRLTARNGRRRPSEPNR